MYIGCGNVPYIFNSTGQDIEITSPNYPRSKLTNLECSYLIVYPQNKVLRLEYSEFEFKWNGYGIKVYDGNSTNADLIFQGSNLKTTAPDPIFSKGNELFVRLKGYSSSGGGVKDISKVLYRIKVKSQGMIVILFHF